MDEPPIISTETRFWSRLSTRSLVRFLLFFASGWALVQLFAYFEYVIVIFTFAGILALLLNYPVRYLERFLVRRIARGIVIAISLLTILVVMILAGVAISTQIQLLVKTIAENYVNSNLIEQAETWLASRGFPIDLDPLKQQIAAILEPGAKSVFAFLPSVFNNFINFLLIITIAFFMLIDGERFWNLILKIVPSDQRERFSTAILQNFLGFLQAKLLSSLFLGISAFVFFLILQIPFALALAMIIAIFNLIPGIGGTLGGLLATLIALIQGGGVEALKVFLTGSVLQQIENVISTRVMQTTVNLNPVVVFFALLIGAKVAGLLGIILSVPIAGIVSSLLEIEEMRSS